MIGLGMAVLPCCTRRTWKQGARPCVSTGRSIHAVPSITPSPREGIEDGPRLPVGAAGYPHSQTRSGRAAGSFRGHLHQPQDDIAVALAGSALGPEPVDELDRAATRGLELRAHVDYRIIVSSTDRPTGRQATSIAPLPLPRASPPWCEKGAAVLSTNTRSTGPRKRRVFFISPPTGSRSCAATQSRTQISIPLIRRDVRHNGWRDCLGSTCAGAFLRRDCYSQELSPRNGIVTPTCSRCYPKPNSKSRSRIIKPIVIPRCGRPWPTSSISAPKPLRDGAIITSSQRRRAWGKCSGHLTCWSAGDGLVNRLAAVVNAEQPRLLAATATTRPDQFGQIRKRVDVGPKMMKHLDGKVEVGWAGGAKPPRKGVSALVAQTRLRSTSC